MTGGHDPRPMLGGGVYMLDYMLSSGNAARTETSRAVPTLQEPACASSESIPRRIYSRFDLLTRILGADHGSRPAGRMASSQSASVQVPESDV